MAGILKYLFLAAILISIIPIVSAETSWNYSIPGTYVWTCPANVTSIYLQMSGGGGSGFGAGGPGWGYRGLGGDNGNYLNKTGITVTPGNDYVIIVGAGAPETPTGLVVGSPGGFSLAFDNNMTGGAGGLMGAINSGNGGAGSTGFLTGGNAAKGGDAT